jgi:putative membrane protein
MLPGVARGSFFDDDAKRRTTQAIRDIEAETSAEVVVAVRPRASHYVETTFAVAAAAALGAFLVMWFSPVVYDVRTIPLDVGFTFVVVAAFFHFTDFTKRLVTPRGVRGGRVDREAERAFAQLGIDKTQDHTGMLVFVSLLEADVRFRLDRNIDRERGRSDFDDVESQLRAAVEKRDIDAFIAALGLLAKPLGAQLPRKDGDVNELSDDVA